MLTFRTAPRRHLKRVLEGNSDCPDLTRVLHANHGAARGRSRVNFRALTVECFISVVRCPWLVPRGHRFGKKPILRAIRPKAPSPAKSLFSRTLPKTSPLSTPGTSQEAQPPTPPLTPPLTPPEGTQTKPQVVVGRWLPPYGQEAPL
jgi:hypothetical protein